MAPGSNFDAASVARRSLANAANALPDVLLSALAAAISWYLASRLLGGPAPLFAPIAAIVCLAPGIANHRQQALGMVAGVAVGIVIGGIGQQLSAPPSAQIALVLPIAMLAAVVVDYRAVVVVQAAASVILVIGSGQASSAAQRLGDAAVGGCVGLLFTQVLFTPDPVKMIERAGERWRSAVAGTDGEAERAAAAALDDAIACAEGIARWSLRGLGRRRETGAAAARWRSALMAGR